MVDLTPVLGLIHAGSMLLIFGLFVVISLWSLSFLSVVLSPKVPAAARYRALQRISLLWAWWFLASATYARFESGYEASMFFVVPMGFCFLFAYNFSLYSKDLDPEIMEELGL